jgi:hypothetical protein
VQHDSSQRVHGTVVAVRRARAGGSGQIRRRGLVHERQWQPGFAHPARAGAQVSEVVTAGGQRDGRSVHIQRHPVPGPAQHPAQRRRCGAVGARRER